MIFPEKKKCCKCCTAEQGCGIVTPDWFVNGQYKSTQVASDGVTTYTYDIKGGQSNLVTQDAEGRTYEIFQQPQSDMNFDVSTYATKVPDGIFDLPTDYKCNRECSALSLCGIVRNMGSKVKLNRANLPV